MIIIKKAFEIWRYLVDTKQSFCFDELGTIWDIDKCKRVIDKDNIRCCKDNIYISEHYIK